MVLLLIGKTKGKQGNKNKTNNKQKTKTTNKQTTNKNKQTNKQQTACAACANKLRKQANQKPKQKVSAVRCVRRENNPLNY